MHFDQRISFPLISDLSRNIISFFFISECNYHSKIVSRIFYLRAGQGIRYPEQGNFGHFDLFDAFYRANGPFKEGFLLGAGTVSP